MTLPLHRLRYLPAAGALWLFFALCRLLPLDAASAMGGGIGRFLGPHLKWHRIAKTNLRAAMPHKTESEISAILTKMWDNLGRTLAEYPWLNSKKLITRIQFPQAALHPHAIYASAHLANWEIAPLASHLRGLPMTLIYRRINNPLVDRMIHRIRSRHCAGLYPKGRRGAAEVLRALKAEKPLGMLVDQKMNDGIEVPFFGLPAMSAPATAELAQRYHVPIVMVRVVRESGASFRLELEEIAVAPEESAAEIMQRIHRQLESWISEFPEQWLWIHRRWGKI